MKPLYVLDHPRFYEACRRHAAAHHISDFSIFCPQIKEHPVPDDLKQHLVWIPPLDGAECGQIDSEAEKWSARWHQLDTVRKNSTHAGLNMAEMLEHGMDYFFVWLFKQRVSALKLLQSLQPSKVFIARERGCKGPFSAPRESYYGYFAEECARSQGIPFEEFADGTALQARSFFEPGYGFRMRAASWVMNVCSSLLLALRPGRRTAVLSSLRVAGPVLGERAASRWLAVTLGPSPRTFLKLFFKGIPTFAILPKSPERKTQASWTADFFPAASARFENIFNVDVPALAAWTDALGSFFRSRRLDTALLDEDVTPLHRLFVQLAEKNGVRCVVVQHGITGNRRGYAPSQASAIAAWGEVSRRQLEGWGIPASRVQITGFPALKSLSPEVRAQLRRQTRRKLRVPEGHQLVLFAPCRLREAEHGYLGVKMSRRQNAHFLRAAVEAMESLPQSVLAVKFHPGENMAYVNRILREPSALDLSNVRLLADYDLHALLASCDAMVVSVSSTVSVEAMAMDVPVVDWDPFDMYRPRTYDLGGSVAHARAQVELEHALAEALADPSARRENRRRFVASYCGPSEGSPASRIVRLLEKLATENPQDHSNKEKIECVSY